MVQWIVIKIGSTNATRLALGIMEAFQVGIISDQMLPRPCMRTLKPPHHLRGGYESDYFACGVTYSGGRWMCWCQPWPAKQSWHVSMQWSVRPKRGKVGMLQSRSQGVFPLREQRGFHCEIKAVDELSCDFRTEDTHTWSAYHSRS
jgi:hypothetical protein